jgi:uncharacterized protein YdeI (BOF family)
MRKAAIAAALVLALFASLAAQQQPGPNGGATEAQLKAVDFEVPQLVTLLELKPGMTVADCQKPSLTTSWTTRGAVLVSVIRPNVVLLMS